MSISANTIFTDSLNTVNQVIGQYVQTVFQNLIQGNSVTITLIFTLYICFIGYRFLTHTLNADLTTIVRHLVVLCIVYGLIMNWSLYNLFFYNIFTNEPNYIASVMTSGASSSPVMYIGDAIDNIFNQGMNAASALYTQANWHNMLYFIYGLIIWGITLSLCVIALCIFIYAKMALAIILALGPLFLLFILWESTNGFFSSWLKMVFGFSLIPIVACAILTLMLSVINSTLDGLMLPAQTLTFKGIMPFSVLALVTVGLLYHTFSIASSLSGGLKLSPQHTFSLAKTAITYTALSAFSQLNSRYQEKIARKSNYQQDSKEKAANMAANRKNNFEN